MKVILASGSPRRKQLLGEIINQFDIISPQCDEQCDATNPQEYVKQLAKRKAHSVLNDNQDSLVIGCDTIVVFNNKILLKPTDRQNAYNMLSSLSNNTHSVYSGVCIVSKHKEVVFCEETKVTFRQLREQDINSYIDTGSCFDKAGAYGIQDSDFVCDISGEFANVMGFPVKKVAKTLNVEFGLPIKKGV